MWFISPTLKLCKCSNVCICFLMRKDAFSNHCFSDFMLIHCLHILSKNNNIGTNLITWGNIFKLHAWINFRTVLFKNFSARTRIRENHSLPLLKESPPSLLTTMCIRHPGLFLLCSLSFVHLHLLPPPAREDSNPGVRKHTKKGVNIFIPLTIFFSFSAAEWMRKLCSGFASLQQNSSSGLWHRSFRPTLCLHQSWVPQGGKTVSFTVVNENNGDNYLVSNAELCNFLWRKRKAFRKHWFRLLKSEK